MATDPASAEGRAALEAWLAARLGADAVRVAPPVLLTGGAIQQNWALDVEVTGGAQAGRHAWVLRTDAESVLAVSRSRAEEFALLAAAHAAGVAVPAPVACGDASVFGRPFFVMARIGGVAAAHRLVRDPAPGGGAERLAAALGDAMARIHAIPPSPALAFLGPADDADAAGRALRDRRAWLDARAEPRPVMEWGLRHLHRLRPPPGEIVLCHNDFRTGNYMVDAGGLTGVLDWEFAAWGDPHEDIGWLCAPCWRFGRLEREVGGVGPFAAFAAAYEQRSGRRIDPARRRFWELVATLRWMEIALDQAARHVRGGAGTLELALTAHMVPALEQDVLRMVEQDNG